MVNESEAMQEEAPFNPIPPLVLAIFAAMMLVEAAFSLGAMGVFGAQGTAWRINAIEEYAFAPKVLELLGQGYGDGALLLRLLAYPFIHADFTHGLFGAVLWLALGKFASEAYRPWAVGLIFLLSAVGGALAYGVYGLWMGENIPLIGAYPADFGMVGAFTYLTWLRLGQEGGGRLQAFAMIAVLMGLQLVFSLLFGVHPTWISDVAGFLIGGLVAILVAPGGWAALVARLRRR